MLPVNLLNALKEYALAQKTPLPATAAEVAQKDAPQFDLGQKLQGSVQAQVAPNVFKVNVSGQLIQMQLPPSVRSGDTVALQVIALQPRLAFSMVNSATPLSTPEQLGSAARLLSSMSQQAPEKAYVRGIQSAPLWVASQPPESKQLAGLLHEALSNSGLFYESHQAQWLGGERSTAQLMHEPQNLAPAQARAAVGDSAINRAASNITSTPSGSAATAAVGTAVTAVSSDASNNGTSTGFVGEFYKAQGGSANSTASNSTLAAGEIANKMVTPEDMTGKPVVVNDNASPARAGNTADTNANALTQPATTTPEGKTVSIPEHLQPLVQQQLNALETRQMMWQGNVWPGQEMKWEVHERAPQAREMETQRQWITQVHLDLPNLGAVTATLRFNSAGLNLALNAGTPQTRAVLGNASSRLVSALSDAGIPVLGTQITNEPQSAKP